VAVNFRPTVAEHVVTAAPFAFDTQRGDIAFFLVDVVFFFHALDGPCRRACNLGWLVLPVLLEVLLQHLLPLRLSPPLLAARADVAQHPGPAILQQLEDHAEQPAERELRRENDRQEEQRQDEDDRTRLVQVFGERRGNEPSDVAAGQDLAVRDVEAAEREREGRRHAGE